MDKRIAEWLASNDTGTSSKAIMLWLSSGVTSHHGADTPGDVGDLGRCLRLLDRIPEWKERMHEMAGAGGLWPTFSKRWPEITKTFFEETGGALPAQYGAWPKCERTYTLLKEVHAEAYAADKPDFEEVTFGAGSLAGCTLRFDKGSALGAAVADKARGGK